MRTNQKNNPVKALKMDIQLARLARLKAAYSYKGPMVQPAHGSTSAQQQINAQ